MSGEITKDLLEKANTELAKRWVRILYLEDVISSQNGVNLRQASEILRDRATMRELQHQLAEVTKERNQLSAALELADALRNRERGLDEFRTIPKYGEPFKSSVNFKVPK